MSTDGRGLDHLMEQNDTELDFLAAYGGVDDGQKRRRRLLFGPSSLCEGRRPHMHPQGTTLTFDGGEAVAEDQGCRLTMTGEHLPLVASDLTGTGFAEGNLNPTGPA